MNLPDAIILQCQMQAGSYIEFGRLAVEALNDIGLPDMTGWYNADTAVRHHDGFDGALAEIEKLSGPYLPIIVLTFPHQSTLDLSFNTRTNLGMIRANMIPESETKESFRDLVGKLVAYLKLLLDSGRIVEGEIWRQGGGAYPLPAVPLVFPMIYAVTVTRSAVEKGYEDLDGFFRSGWEEIYTHGDNRLLLRALQAATGAEFLSAVQSQQRALARIARPRLAIYSGIEPDDEEERSIYFIGPPMLRVTIYLDDEQTLVLTCTVEPHEHVQGWEIDHLYRILRAGKLEDGKVIKAIRVIFPDEASARREKRPLLDVGAQVQYMDGHGDLIPVNE